MNNYLNADEMKKLLAQIELTNNDTKEFFYSFSEIMEELINNYKSDNSVEVNNIKQLLVEKMDIFNINNDNNESIIEKNIVAYTNISSEVENIFNKIGK